MREDNILKQNMVQEEFTAHGEVLIKIEDLKEGDIVKLKDGKYGQIISSGEYANDIDYGEMYKNIKRFKYIDSDTYYLLMLENNRDRHEEKILKHKKEKYRFDLLIYITKNRELITNKYDNDLFFEWRSSEIICNIENIGSFYNTDTGIKLMSTPGYHYLFYKVNLTEQELLKFARDSEIVNKAAVSVDVLDFTKSLNN
ncbi:MAG: hypothetical protein M0Q88_05835 [Bacilli bacterium]|nr:hypothetical protein [Bacilli bacterium]